MYYKIENSYPIISPIPLDGFVEYTEGQEPQELVDALQAVAIEEQAQKLKVIKDKAVADKLALMKYDSLTTVKLWADDAVYGAEATAILNWYKAVTAMSIALENDVKTGVVPMPTEAEYEVMISEVV